MMGRLKTAEEVAANEALAARNRDVLKSIGAGALGLGAGTVGGYLATKGVDAALKRRNGQGIPPGALRWMAPIAMGGMGLAAGSWRAHQDQMMRGKNDRKGQ